MVISVSLVARGRVWPRTPEPLSFDASETADLSGPVSLQPLEVLPREDPWLQSIVRYRRLVESECSTTLAFAAAFVSALVGSTFIPYSWPATQIRFRYSVSPYLWKVTSDW